MPLGYACSVLPVARTCKRFLQARLDTARTENPRLGAQRRLDSHAEFRYYGLITITGMSQPPQQDQPMLHVPPPDTWHG